MVQQWYSSTCLPNTGIVSATYRVPFIRTVFFFVLLLSSLSVLLAKHQVTERQSNRLSKFTYMANAAETLASEEILITTTPKATQIHAGGWVGFKPSAKKQDNVSVSLFTATHHDIESCQYFFKSNNKAIKGSCHGGT